MIKRVLIFALSTFVLFAVSFAIHNYFVNGVMAFKLWHVYLYHALAAFIVYACIEGISHILPNQAGYAYLALMFFKIGIFVLIFKNSVFENDHLTQVERFALVIPLFVFLMAEAIAVAKLLNSK